MLVAVREERVVEDGRESGHDLRKARVELAREVLVAAPVLADELLLPRGAGVAATLLVQDTNPVEESGKLLEVPRAQLWRLGGVDRLRYRIEIEAA